MPAEAWPSATVAPMVEALPENSVAPLSEPGVPKFKVIAWLPDDVDRFTDIVLKPVCGLPLVSKRTSPDPTTLPLLSVTLTSQLPGVAEVLLVNTAVRS